jgi:hypothetical protein
MSKKIEERAAKSLILIGQKSMDPSLLEWLSAYIQGNGTDQLNFPDQPTFPIVGEENREEE